MSRARPRRARRRAAPLPAGILEVVWLPLPERFARGDDVLMAIALARVSQRIGWNRITATIRQLARGWEIGDGRALVALFADPRVPPPTASEARALRSACIYAERSGVLITSTKDDPSAAVLRQAARHDTGICYTIRGGEDGNA